MSKLEKWIVASRREPVLDADTIRKILELGGQIGGGWCEVHQHIHVTATSKEQIEDLLREKGFDITSPTDKRIQHPDRNE